MKSKDKGLLFAGQICDEYRDQAVHLIGEWEKTQHQASMKKQQDLMLYAERYADLAEFWDEISLLLCGQQLQQASPDVWDDNYYPEYLADQLLDDMQADEEIRNEEN